jgi:hypothetical protein
MPGSLFLLGSNGIRGPLPAEPCAGAVIPETFLVSGIRIVARVGPCTNKP